MMASLSGNLATMGPALPYATAAKFAYPDRCVIATLGDGAMQMLGNSELIAVAHYYQQWADPRLVIIVLNNGDLNMVTWEQRVMTGIPKFTDSRYVPAFPYAGYAKLIGLEGIEVDKPELIAVALDDALTATKPVVIEVKVDPEVPPLPPHISAGDAKKLVSSLVHGDPDRWRVIKESVKQLWASMPGR
jgi:pyruvate dehydrogenase (quinone)